MRHFLMLKEYTVRELKCLWKFSHTKKKILLKKKISDLTVSFIFTFCREYIFLARFDSWNISQRDSNFPVKKTDDMGKKDSLPLLKNLLFPQLKIFEN